MINIEKVKLYFYSAYNRYLRRRGVYSFIYSLKKGARVLDVGCGNNFPYIVKTLRPDIYYVGVDVGDYNQSEENKADEYHIFNANTFPEEILRLEGEFDAIISSHNLEHCNDRLGTLNSMMKKVKNGGWIFLAFPSSHSVKLPSRSRTLNYYDDQTHLDIPPNLNEIENCLIDSMFKIDYSSSSYQPFLLFVLGAFQEPYARKKNILLQGTWAYYGFESIIWANKKD